MTPDPTRTESSPSTDDPLAVNLQSRMAFLGLEPEDARALRALGPVFEQFAGKFVTAFYEHLFSFEPTAEFLQDPQRLARLKKLQRDYFDSLLQAQWDDDYAAGRQRIGQTHADVGLPPEYFLGAYNLYIQHFFRGYAAQQDESVQRFVEQVLPLMKVILLDVGLSLDAYFSQATQKLRQALDMYWRANDELRRFAQFTSHDLKTPLATVANLCDEALDEFGDAMPPEARDLIRQARDRTFQNSQMIDELLQSTAALHAADAVADVSLDAVLAEVVQRLAPAATKKGVELSAAGLLPHVWGNKIRLREALYNLCSNAVKFMDKPRGEARVSVSAEPRGEEVLLTVADNGPGIPPEELERIFVPFRRLPAHRHLPGSGLGLHFTKQLIESDGGRIWVESELGQGSRFRVLLPAGRHKQR